jgi:hypothetical protein
MEAKAIATPKFNDNPFTAGRKDSFAWAEYLEE